MTAPTPARHALAELLAPLDEAEFVRSFLGRRYVHLPGNGRSFEHLLDRERLFRLVDTPQVDVFAGTVDEAGGFHQIHIENKHARHMFPCGWSLQLEELHLIDSDLMALADVFREGLGIYSAFEVGAMLSAPGRGYPLHYDPNPDVWVLQVWGHKRWRCAKTPAVENPLAYAILPPKPGVEPSSGSPHYSIGRPPDAELEDVILAPGDVLYFPGGTWHAAQALEESCHIIVASINAPWTDVFVDLLREKLLTSGAWRQVPADHPAGDTMSQVVAARVREIGDVIASMDAEALAEQLREMRRTRRKAAYRQR